MRTDLMMKVNYDSIAIGDEIMVSRKFKGEQPGQITTITWRGVISDIKGDLVTFSTSSELGREIETIVDDVCEVFMVKRAPNKVKITLEDLKDYKKVPIGTVIEFTFTGCSKTERGALRCRTQKGNIEWTILLVTLSNYVYLTEIDESSLYVIEE